MKSYLMIHPARSKQTAPWYATCLHLSNFDIKANDLHRYWLTIPEKKTQKNKELTTGQFKKKTFSEQESRHPSQAKSEVCVTTDREL